MKKIEGCPKNLKQLLQNTKYSIHYYQREYMWTSKEIEEMVDDLVSEFLTYYKDGDERQLVADYGVYFMGSIVLAGRANAIIDGQQRLTSLTLLLMYLNNRLKSIGTTYDLLDAMIFSEAYGVRSFNINVEERSDCMDAIYNGKNFEVSGCGESVVNIYNRYEDLSSIFPIEDISDEMLLHFCDWLAEKVYFIEIVASEEQDAHKIFITMNDRGLNLTSTEMLKGYILSEIKNDTTREKLNSVWKEHVQELKKDDPTGDETFIKAWLRAQYAETIRETRAGAEKEDFDIIGGPFHKWVRDERTKLGLSCSLDYENFIREFAVFADIYEYIRKAENELIPGLEYVYYNAQINFTFQSQLLLASVSFDDPIDVIKEKFNLVARFIDLLIFSRVTMYSSVDYSTIKNYVFKVTKVIRRQDIPNLKKILLGLYEDLHYDIDVAMDGFMLNNFTKKYIKSILARITSFMEVETGVPSNYCRYMDKKTKNPFEIEHIITDHPEWFTSEYADKEEFVRYRNSIGSLLLLNKSINASLNDSLYAKKVEKYASADSNIYAATLHDSAYKNHPRFIKMINKYSLPFKSYSTFGKKEIAERVELVKQLSKLIWNAEMFL